MKQILLKHKVWRTSLFIMFVLFLPSQAAHALSPVRITELHYNPLGNQGAGNDKEFIELYNGSDSTVSLAGWSFYGVNYVFPGGASIGPGRYLVLAKVPAYVPAAVYGQYTGNLEDEGGGETIQLRNASGSVMSQVTYSYVGGWPYTPKNQGPSLSLIRVTANESLSACWAPSAGTGGTPGYSNTLDQAWVAGHAGACSDVAYPTSTPAPSSAGDLPSTAATQPQTEAEKQVAEEQKKAEELKQEELKKQQDEAKKASQKAKEEQAKRDRTMRAGHIIAVSALVAVPALTFMGVVAVRRFRHGKAFKDLLKSDSVKLPKKGKK